MSKRLIVLVLMCFICFSSYGEEKKGKIIVSQGDVVKQDNGEGLGKKLNLTCVSNNTVFWLQKLLESVDKMRTLPNNPYDNAELFAISRLGKICGELVGIRDIPTQSRFASTNKNNVIVKKNGIIEYNGYGSFDTKITGIIQPISDVVYMELKFSAAKNRSVIFRGHLSRFGGLTGTISAEIWNRKNMCWKTQCSLDSVLIAKNTLPVCGKMTVGGVDPWGRIVTKKFDFPISIK